jgi:hypothetical protein
MLYADVVVRPAIRLEQCFAKEFARTLIQTRKYGVVAGRRCFAAVGHSLS